MRITGYRTLTTSQDWGRPVGDVNGVFRDGVVEVGLLLLETDEGITGVGMGLVSEIARLFAALEGEDPRATSALYDRMLRYVFKSGHGGSVFGAIGALDTALWDIKAKAAGQPLWRLLGGRDRVVPAYASGLDIALTDDELCSLYQTYADRGLQAAKLKGGLDVETDRTRLTFVRDLLTTVHGGRVPALMLDANECWTRKQAVRHVSALERTLDLTWVEEPVRRWDAEGMVVVGRSVSGPPSRRAKTSPASSSSGRCWLPAPLMSCRRPRCGASPTSCGWPPSLMHTTCRSAVSAPRRSACCMRPPHCPTTWRPSCRTSFRRPG